MTKLTKMFAGKIWVPIETILIAICFIILIAGLKYFTRNLPDNLMVELRKEAVEIDLDRIEIRRLQQEIQFWANAVKAESELIDKKALKSEIMPSSLIGDPSGYTERKIP